jgi:MFS family permease
MTPDTPEKTFSQPSVPILFGMTSLFGDMTYELAHVLLPVMMIHLGGSASVTALMESTAEGTKLAGFLGAGRLGTNHNRESRLVRWGYGITVLSTSLMGLAGAPAILVLLKSLSWFGKGLWGPARDALLSNSVPHDLLAKAFGTVKALDQIGGLAGPLIALALAGLFSPFAVVTLSVIPGVFCLGFAVWATRRALLSQRSAQVPAGASPVPISASVAKNLLGGAPARRYLLGGMLLRAGTFPATLLMFRFTEGSGTFTVTVLGFLLSSLLTVLTNLGVVRGLVSGTPSRLFLFSLLTLPLSSLLLSSRQSVPALYLLAMMLWGIGEAVSTLGAKVLGASLWPSELRSQGFALFETVATLLSLIVWPMLAHLWDTGHTEAGMTVSALFALAGGWILIRTKV